jgi:mono/diheme cytochrome c family protein
MRKLFILIVFILSILTACENEKIPAPIPPHISSSVDSLKSIFVKDSIVTVNSAIWNTADYFTVVLTNVSTGQTDPTDGILNSSIGTFNGLSFFNYGAKPTLTLKSVYNNNRIYILAQWNDSSLDVSGKVWLWNGPKDPNKSDDSSAWTTQKNDDKLVFRFNFPVVQDYSQDIWLWSAAESDPLGYAIDLSSKSDGTVGYDNGTPMFARNGSSNRSGPLYEYDGTTQLVTKADGSKGGLDATYYLLNKTGYTGNPQSGSSTYANSCAGCHETGTDGAPELRQPWLNSLSRSTINSYIISDSHDGQTEALTLTNAEFDNLIAFLRGQSGLPGYFLQIPSGSIADVVASSNVTAGKIPLNGKNSKGYKVLFSRKLNTGNADDLTFDNTDGTNYTFDVLISNNDSINYIGSLKQCLIFKKTWNEK